MDLIAQLNSLGIDVRCKFPNINNGGCAVFASIVGKKLRDMKVTVRAVVMHYDCGVTQTPHIDKAREKIKNTGKKKNWNVKSLPKNPGDGILVSIEELFRLFEKWSMFIFLKCRLKINLKPTLSLL